jgi:peptidoglycan hydrolase-like protein with peptidoglycan-binding domain
MSRLPGGRRSLALLVLVAGGAAIAVGTGILPARSAAAGTGDPTASTPPPKTADVARKTMTIEETLDGTIGYDGDREVIANLAGTLTWLPAEGSVLHRGSRLYEVDGRARAVLMYGARPAWRTLDRHAADGPDILQLERNLKALGFTRKGDKIDRHWDADTTAAVKRWQKAAKLPRDGRVDLGEVVFLPGAVRVTERPTALGSRVGPGGPVLTGTSDQRVVTVDLAADRSDLVAKGDKVELTLPDGSTTPGTIAVEGTVATAGAEQPGGGHDTPTIKLTIRLDDPAASAAYESAPVEVHVVRESRADVLAVPVNALLALVEGGYALQRVEPDGSTKLVRVELGIFQDAWVEVRGDGLAVGDHVVVPS